MIKNKIVKLICTIFIIIYLLMAINYLPPIIICSILLRNIAGIIFSIAGIIMLILAVLGLLRLYDLF